MASANQSTQINYTRVIEALVIGVVTSLLVYVASVPKLEAKLEAMEEKQREFKTEVTAQVRDVKDEVRELRKDLYIPANKPTGLSYSLDSSTVAKLTADEPANMTPVNPGNPPVVPSASAATR